MGRMAIFIAVLSFPISLIAQVSEGKVAPDTTNLQEVVVKSFKLNGKDKLGSFSISGTEINKRPSIFGEHDVIKALQTTAGVVSGTEGFAGLYVRGGETDQNLYLTDGLPLLNVYHFGGLFSTFSTFAVEQVNFYKGVFPSLYAERASSIVDISLKKPDYYNTHGVASLGLVSGQLYFSTPLKKGTSALSVSLRRTWFDVFSIPAIAVLNATKKKDGEKKIFHYNFTDLMIKLCLTDNYRNNLSLLLFMGKDNFKLGNERFNPDEKNSVYERDINHIEWGNLGVGINYQLATKIANLKIQPYITRAFSSDVQSNIRDEDTPDYISEKTEIKPSVLQIGIRELFESHVINWLNISAGMQQVFYDYNIGYPKATYGNKPETNGINNLNSHSKNAILSVFGEAGWNIKGRFEGSAGLRVNQYLSHEENHLNLEPRLNARFRLSENTNVSLGYSRITQYAQQVSSNYIYLPSDAWLPTACYHKPLICDIYSLGYFMQWQRHYIFKAEAWYKNMQNLAEFKPNTSAVTTVLPWHDKLTYGKGRAYGLDVELEGQYERISWNIAYGLMWNWRKFSALNSGNRFPAKFDNRHKLDIGAAWHISKKFELTAQWEYMTGNRTTIALYNVAPPNLSFPDVPFVYPVNPDGKQQDGIEYIDTRNNVRIPSFHRLNLNLSRKGRLNKKLTYQWDFGLYNAYCHMNPFTLTKNYVDKDWNGKGEYRKFRTLSLIPILPSVSYTLNF